MGLINELLQLRRNSRELQRLSGAQAGIGGLRDVVAEANQTLAALQIQSAENQRLVDEGIPGTGIITALRDTGATLGESPQVELDLQIVIPDRPPFSITYRRVINRLDGPQFQPGATRPVRVDPADPARVLVL